MSEDVTCLVVPKRIEWNDETPLENFEGEAVCLVDSMKLTGYDMVIWCVCGRWKMQTEQEIQDQKTKGFGRPRDWKSKNEEVRGWRDQKMKMKMKMKDEKEEIRRNQGIEGSINLPACLLSLLHGFEVLTLIFFPVFLCFSLQQAAGQGCR